MKSANISMLQNLIQILHFTNCNLNMKCYLPVDKYHFLLMDSEKCARLHCCCYFRTKYFNGFVPSWNESVTLLNSDI